MKTYPLQTNLKQDYLNYTAEDKAVWKILFERQMALLKHLAAPEYLEAVEQIGFDANKIPNFEEVNECLELKTGWKLEVVDGIISELDFYELLASKKFPATTWLRKLSELDYLSEPDMFHDVFGHAPMLVNKGVCDFYEAFGKLGVQHKNDSEIVRMLGRLYWFTIEFGLIQNKNELQIYGAGILSSHGESKFAVSDEPKHIDFNTEAIMNTNFDNSVIQNTYFVLNSFDDLYTCLSKVETLLAKSQKQKINLGN